MVTRTLTGITLVIARAEPARVYQDLFAGAGASVTTAPTADQALALIPMGQPAIVIADLRQRESVWLLLRIRAVADFIDIPVVAFAAPGEQRSVAEGFDDVLKHPVDPADLLTRIVGLARQGDDA